jgi:hypothetical protein
MARYLKSVHSITEDGEMIKRKMNQGTNKQLSLVATTMSSYSRELLAEWVVASALPFTLVESEQKKYDFEKFQ